MSLSRGIYIITGIMASGKSTIAQLLAEQFERGVHVKGDVFRRMIVSGRVEMTPENLEEANRQLLLRYRLAMRTAEAFYKSGFSVVVQDNYLGDAANTFIKMFTSKPLYLITLCPSEEAVTKRENERGKKGYGAWDVKSLNSVLHNNNPKIGLWIDSSDMTPQETVNEIINRVDKEGRIL